MDFPLRAVIPDLKGIQNLTRIPVTACTDFVQIIVHKIRKRIGNLYIITVAAGGILVERRPPALRCLPLRLRLCLHFLGGRSYPQPRPLDLLPCIGVMALDYLRIPLLLFIFPLRLIPQVPTCIAFRGDQIACILPVRIAAGCMLLAHRIAAACRQNNLRPLILHAAQIVQFQLRRFHCNHCPSKQFFH